jgi:hypothetical protein
VVVVAEDRVDAVASAQRREPARALFEVARIEVEQVAGENDDVGARGVGALDHVVELRAIEPVADVQVADLRDAQAGQIRVQLRQRHTRVGHFDPLLSDREAPRGLARDRRDEQHRRGAEHADHRRARRAERPRRAAEQRERGPARDHRESDDQRRDAGLDVETRNPSTVAAAEPGHDPSVRGREHERRPDPGQDPATRLRERDRPEPVRDQRLEHAERGGQVGHEPAEQLSAQERETGELHWARCGCGRAGTSSLASTSSADEVV